MGMKRIVFIPAKPRYPLKLNLQQFSDDPPADVAILVGELKAKVEALESDVARLNGEVEMFKDVQRWTRDDISALFTELSSVAGKVDDLETPADPEPEPEPTPPADPEPEKKDDEQQFDKSSVEEKTKKYRRWGVFD